MDIEHALQEPTEDLNTVGITSLVFTDYGEAFYLHSSSEFQRVTLSTTKITAIKCRLELPSGARNKSKDESTDGEEDDEDTVEENHEAEESDKEEEKVITEKLENIEVKENVLNDSPPLVNGTCTDNIKENGIDVDNKHDISIGDITIDSVKDHLLNSNHSLEEVTEETKTTVVVKTTTTTIMSESTITSPPTTLEFIDTNANLLPNFFKPEEINIYGKAPLAKMEDLEIEHYA